jgi:hypothetical protein
MTVLHANRKVREANLLAEALHKDTVFKVTLTVSYTFIGDSSPFPNQPNSSCFTWREREGVGFKRGSPLHSLFPTLTLFSLTFPLPGASFFLESERDVEQGRHANQ